MGDGSPMYFQDRGNSGQHRFFTDEELCKWPAVEKQYAVESKTLKQIFDDYHIDRDKPYIIKIDCEGGERFLMQEEFLEESLDIIGGSVQTMMEIHFGLGGQKEQWDSFYDRIRDTHELRFGRWIDKGSPDRRYVYTAYHEMLKGKGRLTVEFVDRKWVGPWPGRGK